MTESFHRSSERRPHGPGMSEPVMAGHAPAVDEDRPGQLHRRPDTLPADPPPDQSATPTRSVLKRPLLLTVAAALLSLAALAGIRYYRYLVTHVWTDDAFIEGRIIQISPKVAGHVVRVYVTDNQAVQQGDLLLDIDPGDYATRLAQAGAVLQATLTRQQAAQN